MGTSVKKQRRKTKLISKLKKERKIVLLFADGYTKSVKELWRMYNGYRI